PPNVRAVVDGRPRAQLHQRGRPHRHRLHSRARPHTPNQRATAMSDYQIKIVTTAEGDGAKKTADELKKLDAAGGSVNAMLEAQAKGEKNAASVTEELTTKKLNL